MSRFQFGRPVEGRSSGNSLLQTALAIPPNAFSITMGLAGLAGVWQLAGKLYGFPFQISSVLYLATTVVYLLLCSAFVCKALYTRKIALANLTHPVLGPFNALLPITGMLLT